MISVGVVGMGKMGLTHSMMVETAFPGSLKALVETERDKHPLLRSMGFRVPIYSDLEAMLKSEALDAVFVCTPNFTHYDLVRDLMERGIAVLVEKPLSESLEKCTALAQMASGREAVNAVGYSIDYDPVFLKARELLGDSALGRVLRYWICVEHSEVLGPKKGWFFQKAKSGGGVIINPAPHMLFTLLKCFGPPAEVRAKFRSHFSQVEDEAIVHLSHPSGCTGMLWACWSVPDKPALSHGLFVEGEDGSMAVENEELLLEIRRDRGEFRVGTYRYGRAELSVEKGPVFEFSPQAYTSNYCRQDLDFLGCCLRKEMSRNSFQNTLIVDQLIAAIYASAQEGRPVSWNF